MPVIIDGTNGITQAGEFNSDSSFGLKNRIINGGQTIDQRNAGAAVTVNGNSVFITDRFRCDDDTDGAYTAQQVSTAPVGFKNSVQVTVTTADASLSASQYALFYHSIEGNNSIADLNWGTANAKTVTLSFWVRSSLTGTFSGSLENNANNRSYIFTYSISVANTFEYKTITIEGDTSGTWETGTAVGIRINWSLGVGSSFLGTAGAWGNRFFGSTGSVSLIGTNSSTWFITGIQLEAGSVATSFDYRSIGTELALCQRYFVRLINGNTQELGSGWNYDSSQASGLLYAPVSMRATPSIISSSGTDYYIFYRNGAGDSFNSITIENSNATNNVVSYFNNSQISGTAGQCGVVRSNNASASVALSSEL